MDPDAPIMGTVATIPPGWRDSAVVLVPADAQLVVIGSSDVSMVHEFVRPLGKGERGLCELRLRPAATVEFGVPEGGLGTTLTLAEDEVHGASRPLLAPVPLRIPGSGATARVAGVPVPFAGSVTVNQGLRSWSQRISLDSAGVQNVLIVRPLQSGTESTATARVVDEAGDPIQGAVVNWIGHGALRSRSVTTADGVAVGDVDPAALVVVDVWARGYVSRTIQPRETDVPLVMVRSGTLVLSLDDDLGGRHLQVIVSRDGRRVRRIDSVVSEAGGALQVVGLEAGQYQVQLVEIESDGTPTPVSDQVVRVTSGDDVHVRLPDHMSSSCQPRQSRSTAEIALCASLGAVLLAAGIGKSLNLDSRLFMQSFLLSCLETRGQLCLPLPPWRCWPAFC